ncbi:MAG: OsmC family peroxiredoxin [Dehalococcoidia bacterium]|nr:OsmC family peroxiredoxin [Dehalococcoidia bacterium]
MTQATGTDEKAGEVSRDTIIHNGIDVGLLFGTMGVLLQRPDLGRLRFRARNRWVGGQHNRTVLKDFYCLGKEDGSRREPFILDAGQPPVMAGANEGPDPGEYLLHALAASLTTTLVYLAAARGIELADVQSSVEGELDLRGALGLSPDVRAGFESIHIRFQVKADAPDETVRQLIALMQQRSVVFETLTRGVPVEVTLE